ncbi:endonuclease [Thiohalobacter thiocyanaticus]|uniref:Endonuclease I n=1 Tax=Thiohalobacter thiocyanaticus TaxID=585455 RepID=A0A426QJI1_9GAMM|nr:hypothetical protein D6C00_08075 [Thiohalobacter thiocyanaticus]
MGDFLGCGTREECRDSSERFNRMEADLHNLWASLDYVNRHRSNYEFRLIDGEGHSLEGCDIERIRIDGEYVIEPRQIARGNVARSIFYMHSEYGLPIPDGMRDVLLEWNKNDPPSCHEMRRNNTIERLQGTRNRYIDHPSTAETSQ